MGKQAHLKEIIDSFCIDIIIQTRGCILHSDDTITKIVNGEPIRKKSVGRKDFSHDWIENVKVEDIDTRYFNLDYTRK